MRVLTISILLLLSLGTLDAQIGGRAGAFSRLGFGARGMGMGNAGAAVTTGAVSTYYNPALGAFASSQSAGASFGILSLDRSLNFLNYTTPVKPLAGLSFSLINAGVHDIDGRDGNGQHTEDYSTMENQIAMSFSNRVDERVSIGVNVKFLYSRLFEGVKSTTVGFDLGVAARLTDELSLGAALVDLGSKYKWDTKEIYGENGRATEDKFPSLRKIGLAYAPAGLRGIVSAEFENSSASSNCFRVGAEYALSDAFTVRGGIDRIETGDDATGAKPSFGFSVTQPWNGLTPSLHYTFVSESFAPHGMHIITLSTGF